MFNRIPFMVGWLQKLGDVAEAVCQFLESVRVPNNIPSNNQTMTYDSKGQSNITWDKRHPLHNR